VGTSHAGRQARSEQQAGRQASWSRQAGKLAERRRDAFWEIQAGRRSVSEGGRGSWRHTGRLPFSSSAAVSESVEQYPEELTNTLAAHQGYE